MEQQPQVGTTFIPVSKEDDDVLKAEEKKMIMKEKEDGNAGNNHKENDGGFFANKCWNVKTEHTTFPFSFFSCNTYDG